MKGIILGITLHDHKSQLKVNDLVCIDGSFFNLNKIDNRFMKKEGESDNEYMYFVTEPVSGEPMNFKRDELSKANIGIFDSVQYFATGKKIMIGNIMSEDLRNMKARVAIEWDIPSEKIDSLTHADILELEFEGDVITKEVTQQYPDDLTPPTIVKYFKLK